MIDEIEGLQREAYRQGEATFEVVVSAELDVLQARLELASTSEERNRVRREMLGPATQLEQIVTELFKARQSTSADVLRAKCLRLRRNRPLT